MTPPGFHVYRQDCNVFTMPFWRAAEATDRQGITEMKYIAGLYEYWDAIRAKYPDAFLEECSGAGPRTDLDRREPRIAQRLRERLELLHRSLDLGRDPVRRGEHVGGLLGRQELLGIQRQRVGRPTVSSIILSPSSPLPTTWATASALMRDASFFEIDILTKIRSSFGSEPWSTPVT